MKETGYSITAEYIHPAELRQFRDVMREIRMKKRQLTELYGAGGNFAGMPVGRGVSFSLCRDRICEELAEREQQLARIERYIETLPDSMLRQIYTYYYLYGWSWQKIAFETGGSCEATPRLRCRRYQQKCEREIAAGSSGKRRIY